jgi:hypothetical protein
VKWLDTAWKVLRDIVMTSAGITLGFLEAARVFGNPNSLAIGFAAFLVTPAAVQKVVTIALSGQSEAGRGPGPSSAPALPGSSPTPSPPARGRDEAV